MDQMEVFKETEQELKNRARAIEALGEIYTSMYFLDINTGKFTELASVDAVQSRIGRSGDIRDRFDYFCRNMVAAEHREEVAEFLDLSTLDQRMKGTRIVSKQYQSNLFVDEKRGGTWRECSFIEIDRGADGRLTQVLFTTKSVHDVKVRELEALELMREEMNVAGALSREYSSLFKIDAHTRQMTLYRTDGVTFDPSILSRFLEIGDYEIMINKYIDMYVAPKDRTRLRESISLPVLMERVPDVGLFKLGFTREIEGVHAYFELNIAKTVDEEDNITFILGFRDVDEEMRRQLKQTREMELQREIIEGLGSEYYSVLLVDLDNDYVSSVRVNERMRATTESIIEVNGNCWSSMMMDYAMSEVSEKSRREYLDKMSIEYLRSQSEDYSLTVEVRIDGEYHYIQLRMAYVHEADGSRSVVIGTRDVDDLIQKERIQEMALQEAFDAAEAANRAKTDFLSNMSHDIRTPMNGIIGMTAIAAAHIDEKERVRDSLQKITKASKHLLSLINEVLDMSKIESGKVDLVEEEFNLSDLVENLISMSSSSITAHNHNLSVNITGVTHEAVIGDSLHIQKVFTNLMSNAVKYTPDGGSIRLIIREKPSNQSKVGCYEFVFEDNGIGMDEEFLKIIFDPFVRANDERVNSIQGTGLGMPITRNIVRMMGGDINVESKLGEGSRFTVTMYLKLQDTAEVDYDRFVDLDVLVADDDQLSLESCCGMLNDFGMKAEGVSSGAEAVEKVIEHHEQKRDYFACIIDWKMPEMDGIATTRAIRKAVGRDVPIIIISAYDWSDIEQEARAAGADAFISKPLFRSRLSRTFAALVGEDDMEEPEKIQDIGSLELSGKRALLAEDNELNAEIAREILGMTGIDVECAADGIEAVDKVMDNPEGYYDIIFMDIQMPRMNGYDAARAIRAVSSKYCKSVPIIAMTANAFAEDVLAAKSAGMNEHIAKPMDLNVLARTLVSWLGDK